MFKQLHTQFLGFALAFAAVALVGLGPQPAVADTAAEIEHGVNAALQKLYASTPAAKRQAEAAKAIMVFPEVVKAGLMVGGTYGVGALRVDGKTVGYYRNVEGSYGLQAGIQKFGYALFFMNQKSLDYARNADGWEFGIGPSITVVDEGLASSLTNITGKDDVYAFFFDQKGLMGGLGLRGGKISKYTPE
jgi:lipid-binding SYLF domain-containing protein